MKKEFGVLILLCFGILTSAQHKISGVVIDLDGFPADKTRVVLEPNVETITNIDGEFVFENISNGKYTLKVEKSADVSNPFKTKVTIQNQNKFVKLEEQSYNNLIINPYSNISLDPMNFIIRPPFSAKNIKAKDLKERNLGQDLPILLKHTPSVVSTSDAGTGVGYTGLRIRGSDQTRINVTLNGIPVNDSESQGVFWVNTPDLTSSVDRIVIQRGVGTSTNGPGAFGASVNIETQRPEEESYLRTAHSYGTFNTRKHTFQAGLGQFSENFTADARVSFIDSDGYVDRASSDLFSYNANLQYKTEKTKLWFTTFGGSEITYQSWFGIDQNTLQNDRRFNPSGQIFDTNGNSTGFYDNQVDNYRQNHYQLHYEQSLDNVKIHIAAHYTKGKGFFEEYQNIHANQNLNFTPERVVLANYGLQGGISDLVRRQWLDNDFYGITYNINKHKGNTQLLLGGAINRYDGDHFGRVISVANGINFFPNTEYYRNNGRKDEFSSYTKINHKAGKFDFFGDLQLRLINYRTRVLPGGESVLEDDVRPLDESFTFLNPKAGVSYNPTVGQFYFSYALAQREPNRSDFFDTEENPEPETLHNFELGFRKNGKTKFLFTANMYYMYYLNQLVLTGELNDVGAPIRSNSGESQRFGIEIETQYNFNSKLNIFGNSSISTNRNLDWQEKINNSVEDFGRTNISYSPEFIGNIGLEWKPIKDLQVQYISKFVGKQFMSNANFEQSILDSYHIGDLIVNYNKKDILFFKNIGFQFLVNNVWNKTYENNGFYFNFFDANENDPRGLNHNPFFYPQAGINILAGITLDF